MTNIVEVVPYNPMWSKIFAEEARLIKQALGSNCIEIYHIGSTSVPGLSAKPIIDMLPVVLDISAVDKSSNAMEAIGYEVKGEYGIPFRRFFQKGKVIRTHHVHVFEKDDVEIDKHLLFRDWMRAHQDDRDAYAKLKIMLAAKFPKDSTAYCLGKDEFIASIITKTGFNKLSLRKALTDREWQAARHFRQKYFFAKIPVLDPYTWSFDDKNHVHFVCYQGATIVAYAHIQLWSDERAALRIIVIDEIYRNQGIGSQFLQLIERWLKLQGIARLQIQSSQKAYNFYIRHQYIDMPFNDPDGYESDPNDVEVGKIL